jgi:hypothetical protein
VRYWADECIGFGAIRLLRVQATDDVHPMSAEFAAAPAQRWAADGWQPCPGAQAAITAWMSDLGEISPERVESAQAEVLAWHANSVGAVGRIRDSLPLDELASVEHYVWIMADGNVIGSLQ